MKEVYRLPQIHRPSYESKPRASRDRWLLVLAIILLLVGVGGYVADRITHSQIVPADGGVYTEGMLNSSPAEVDQAVAHLTNIGLTTIDKDGKILPAMAKSWTVSLDGKQYTFILNDAVSADGVLALIKNAKNGWESLNVTATNEHTILITLNQPYAQLLTFVSNPIFPYGPYQVTKRDKNQIELGTNPDYVLGQPKIAQVVIKLFGDNGSLSSALSDGNIDGTADLASFNSSQELQQVLSLPRYQVVFFNDTRAPFNNLNNRKRVANELDGAKVTYRLVTVDNSTTNKLVDTLTKELAPHNITLQIDKKPNSAALLDAISKKDFDLLLYGIDYGIDPDYYPFWHSSQATSPGLNISGVKDKQLDTLVTDLRGLQDSTARQAKVAEINKYLADNALCKVMSEDSVTVITNKRVSNVILPKAEEASDRFGLISQWYIATKRQ